MTTAKEFKDLGLIPVIGDEYTFRYYKNAESFKSIIGEDESWAGQLQTDGGIYDDEQLSMLTPLSFAWRPLNTLPDNPKFKYEVDATPHQWRPLLDQSSTETPEEKEAFDKMKPYEFAEHVSAAKPVFTQAMSDAGELPPIGADCVIHYVHEGFRTKKTAIVKGFFGKKVWFSRSDGCDVEFTCNIDEVKFLAFDTRTPKQKAVDELSREIELASSASYSELAELLLNLGYKKVLDQPPSHCESQQQIAIEIMQSVNGADLSKIKSANKDKKILRKALDNYVNEQLSVSDFSIMIYEGCENE